MNPYNVPDSVLEQCLGVLVFGSATATGDLPGPKLKVRIAKLAGILNSIMRRHLSDSPVVDDKKKMNIEILETALKISKGEFVP